MVDKSVFDYSAKFYDEDGTFIDTDGIGIVVDRTDDPENDAHIAYFLADDWAEEKLEECCAYEYELTLEDAG